MDSDIIINQSTISCKTQRVEPRANVKTSLGLPKKKIQSQVISRLERTWWQLTDNDHKCFWQQPQLLLFPPASHCSRLPRSRYCTKYRCDVRKRLPLFPKRFFCPVALTQGFLQHGTCSVPATWGAPASVTSSYIDNSRLINYPFTATSTHVSSAPTKV